jgi:hypothetical protein
VDGDGLADALLGSLADGIHLVPHGATGVVRGDALDSVGGLPIAIGEYASAWATNAGEILFYDSPF